MPHAPAPKLFYCVFAFVQDGRTRRGSMSISLTGVRDRLNMAAIREVERVFGDWTQGQGVAVEAIVLVSWTEIDPD